jgi:hypothetical protein
MGGQVWRVTRDGAPHACLPAPNIVRQAGLPAPNIVRQAGLPRYTRRRQAERGGGWGARLSDAMEPPPLRSWGWPAAGPAKLDDYQRMR